MARRRATAPNEGPEQIIETTNQLAAPVPKQAPDSAPAGPALISKTVKSEFHQNLYCNNVRVAISQWDLGLGIGQIVEGQDGVSVAKEEVSIKFSPPFFKSLVVSLTAALQQWEATFGEITVGIGQTARADNIATAFEALKGVLTDLERKDRPKG